MTNALKNGLRTLAYASGMLGLAHRMRNRRTLTVFMFHRVLPVESEAYTHADKEFTFTIEGFGQTLDFIRRHYNIVPHTAIHAHIERRVPLPDRAGLITFDDGWRDTLVHALPELKKRNLPAVLFLATEVLELPSSHWWQDRLVEALTQTGNRETLEAALGIEATRTTSERHWQLTASLASLTDRRRHELLNEVTPPRQIQRQMLNEEELAALQPVISVAGHGHTHVPLTHCNDTATDLSTCHERLKSLRCDAWAMSFPHGAYRGETAKQARLARFEAIYTSDACLVDTSNPLGESRLLGRIHIPENEWTCTNGLPSCAKLATYLFFRRIM